MAQLNAVSKTYQGHSDLLSRTPDGQAVIILPPVASRDRQIVGLGNAAAENTVPAGAYTANPGHEDGSVSVNVKGEFWIRMKELVDADDLNKGVVLSDTPGTCKSAASGGLGRIQGGRAEDGKYWARVLV